MNTYTIYEFPLNERIRVFIRLEQLFQQLNHFMLGKTIFDKRAAITNLLDILMIFSRNNLKSELLKELDRCSSTLSKIPDTQDINIEKLQHTLSNLDNIRKKLHEANGKIDINVMESDLFQSISQRSSIPGGTCSFDLPAFHYWLEQTDSIQRKDLKRWSEPFYDVRTAINLILSFIRQSSTPTQELAEAGFFQLSLNQSLPFQLLRITVERSVSCFAEISGGRHRFTIHFMEPSPDNNRPSHTSLNVIFSLTRCIF